MITRRAALALGGLAAAGAMLGTSRRAASQAPQTVRIPIFSDWARSAPFPALAVALDRAPDFVIFLGDLDHSNPTGLRVMREMHRRLLDTTSALGRDMKRLLIDAEFQVPVFHMWDDHDMRGDDANKSFGRIDHARQAFREYWPMPTDAGPNTAIYQSWSWGPLIDVFLPDCRSERDRKIDPDTAAKSMLGVDQKDALKAWALASTATWKLIPWSVPWNPTAKDVDAWQGYQTEAHELLDFFDAHAVTNVLFASGDMHTGGCLDDGTHSGRPEMNVPRANRCGNTTGKLGLWSHGRAGSGEGDGFGELVVTSESATLSIVGDTGLVRRALTLSRV